MATIVATPNWKRRVTPSGILLGGAVAGAIGGIFMGGAFTLWAFAVGMGASTPWQAFAATFYGPMAFIGAAGVTAIGVLLYLAVAALIGIIFSGLSFNARSTWPMLFWGVLFGTGVWAVMTYVFVPIFDATLGARIALFLSFWFFLHWIYGAFTGLFIPSLRRAFSGSVPAAEAPQREAA